MTAEPAFFHSGSTPLYSNNGFELFGLALENMTGSSVEDLFTEGIVDALGLRRTSYAVPNNTQNAVIPGNATASGWSSEMGVLSP